MQGTTAATLRKGLQRFVGTLVGIPLGSIVSIYIHNPNIIDALLVISLFVAYWLKSFNLVNYGIFVIPLSFMVVCLFTAIAYDAVALTWARLYDSVIGIISLIITFVVLPSSIKPRVNNYLSRVKRAKEYLDAIADWVKTDEISSLRKSRDAYLEALSKNRELHADWRYRLAQQAPETKNLANYKKRKALDNT